MKASVHMEIMPWIRLLKDRVLSMVIPSSDGDWSELSGIDDIWNV